MIEKLSAFEGIWEGKGVAAFPTIVRTEYLEELKFGFFGDEESILFEQKTWLIENEKKGKPLHWESGFITAYADGTFELFNAQNSKRVEILKCEAMEVSDNVINLKLVSKYFGNDDRMVRTERNYIVNGNSLKYEMKMATQNTPEFQIHLAAELKLK